MYIGCNLVGMILLILQIPSDKHVTTLNRECRQQLDWVFPLVLADSERYRQDLNLGP